jgi:holo-[acyl-carrier protein] synthase
MRIGLDVVDVDRFRHSLRRTPGMVDRLFTEAERAYASTARDPAERFAVRFAAKEATMKALGVGLGAFGFLEAEVVRPSSGPPTLELRGRAAALAAAAGITRWELSLTHSRLVAIAVVVAL